MSAIPTELQYTAEHEWVTTGNPATIGITANAADALGDVVYLELPEVGSQVTAGSVGGEIESTKSVRQALHLCDRSGFSRIPVVGENVDDVLGVVYLKDMVKRSLNSEENGPLLTELMRPAVCGVAEPDHLQQLGGTGAALAA